eukprot:CAMPEP_0202474320 /NCGR_PEP_ID=MMETSP1360-20130828/92320_1 /ASSEMBLY_ACC=CAM_ASM_000848 /TAXON_ID=515479 /ORGANISM="Licmophora paradoxa, Strain CCMP2313" /LENGTH=231 /DNA_ID=CAMNT_0049101437 /DNA_START=1074 /DNA_END=1765 /DNA_ORIENTATION=+
MTSSNMAAKVQYTNSPDTSPALDLDDKKCVQEVLGTLLYYARAIDSTIVPDIGTITTQQANPTRKTIEAVTQLLNYFAIHPNAIVRYRKSNMILHACGDASYLSVPKGRSRAAGYFYLSDKPIDPNKPPVEHAPPPTHNGAITINAKIKQEVLSSTTEAELAILFHNGREAYPLRTALEELGHPQPPTPILTDNVTVKGIANDDIRQKRSKVIDMRFCTRTIIKITLKCLN